MLRNGAIAPERRADVNNGLQSLLGADGVEGVVNLVKLHAVGDQIGHRNRLVGDQLQSDAVEIVIALGRHADPVAAGQVDLQRSA
jgi:hypothetical protein